jgi:hypothetical protein
MCCSLEKGSALLVEESSCALPTQMSSQQVVNIASEAIPSRNKMALN